MLHSAEDDLILLDDALPAGTFQIAAELGRLFGGSERTDHGAVIDPLVAEIGALNDRRTGPQRGRKLVLQPAVGGLRVGLVLLRGDTREPDTDPLGPTSTSAMLNRWYLGPSNQDTEIK